MATDITESDRAPKFTFQYLTAKKFHSIDGKDSKEMLTKWSLYGRLKAQAFSFDQQFQSYQKDDFVLEFFQDPRVLYHLQVLSSSEKWVQLGVKCTRVTVDAVPCTALSMAYFDRLYEHNIVRESGKIHQCFDEYSDEFTISDELRKMLLVEDSDNFDIYSQSEKDEFLFRLFRHICLGGAVCQYEDDIQPYLDVTKLIYKDLVSVQKDAKTNEIQVTSLVYSVAAYDETEKFYPSAIEHPQNFAYLVIDPIRRHVNVLYHKFGTAAFE